MFLTYQQSIIYDKYEKCDVFDILLFKAAIETPNNAKFYRNFFGDTKGVNQNTMFSYFI